MLTTTESMKQAGYEEDSEEMKHHKSSRWYIEKEQYKEYQLWINSRTGAYISIDKTKPLIERFRVQFVYGTDVFKRSFATFEEATEWAQNIFGLQQEDLEK